MQAGGGTCVPGRCKPKAIFGLGHERGGAHARTGNHSLDGVGRAHGDTYADTHSGPPQPFDQIQIRHLSL